MVISEQSNPPDSVEEYKFDFYQKSVQPGPVLIRKWRFYLNGKTWLVDKVRGESKTIDSDTGDGHVIIRCRLKIETYEDSAGSNDIAYMRL